MSKIFVINAGSSSLKFELFDVGKTLKSSCEGIIDGIGLWRGGFRVKWSNGDVDLKVRVRNQKKALALVFRFLQENGVVKDIGEISAVGHRVVHGGEQYREATLIDGKVMRTIKKLSELAPLHNPANLAGIAACRKLLRRVPNVAVFDTSFHNTLPEKAFLYGLPYSLYRKSGIRRYGFHGINHQYVIDQVRKKLKKKGVKVISCHLGNGASVAASIDGKCVDTSMGFTPLEGLLMGTRCGDLDPAIVFYLMEKKRMSVEKIDDLLNKESGLKGVSEISSDMRVIYDESKKKNPAAKRAMDLFNYRITKYIGAYAAAMGGVDAVVFTAGVGENAWYLRRDICKSLAFLGIKLDARKNKKNDLAVHAAGSKTKVYVVPANEQLQIAQEVARICLS